MECFRSFISLELYYSASEKADGVFGLRSIIYPRLYIFADLKLYNTIIWLTSNILFKLSITYCILRFLKINSQKSYKNSTESSYISLTQLSFILTCYIAIEYLSKLISKGLYIRLYNFLNAIN